MCFTPQVSFLIFAIEFILGLIVLWKTPKGKYHGTYVLSALILFCLGLYQFSQFGLCTFNDINLWGRMGFLAYNILPALGLHLAYSLTNSNRRSLYAIYAFPIFFGLAALFLKNFVTSAQCSTVYVIVEHVWTPLWQNIYGVYYALFTILMAIVLWDAIKKERTVQRRKILWAGLAGLIAFTVPTFVLIILLPALKLAFPSIFCEFALLFAIFLFYMIGLIEKSKSK